MRRYNESDVRVAVVPRDQGGRL